MSNSFFDPRGEINASSVRDALNQIAKFASLMDNQPSNTGLASRQVSLSDQDDLASRAISTQEGKIVLAQAMASPIRKNLDYHGLARRALVVDPLN